MFVFCSLVLGGSNVLYIITNSNKYWVKEVMDHVDIGFFEECIRFQTTLFILFFAKHFHKMKISGHFSNFFILHVFYCNILDILEEMNFISYKIFASSFRVLS